MILIQCGVKFKHEAEKIARSSNDSCSNDEWHAEFHVEKSR